MLRFLIRRAIRNGRLLGYPREFMAELASAVVASLESGYPELRARLADVQNALRTEEAGFLRTLDRGSELLEALIAAALEDCTMLISGEDAFVLHDTYGFPYELTREIAAERGVAVDTIAFEREDGRAAPTRARRRGEQTRRRDGHRRARRCPRRSKATVASKRTVRCRRFSPAASRSSRSKPVRRSADLARPHVVLRRKRRSGRRPRPHHARRRGVRGDRHAVRRRSDRASRPAHARHARGRRRSAYQRVSRVARRDPPPPHFGALAAARAQGRARRRDRSGRFVGGRRSHAVRFPQSFGRAHAAAEARGDAARQRADSRRLPSET